MGRREYIRNAPRCDRCKRLSTICVCDESPALELQTRLCLVAHYGEIDKTTNSGTIAARFVAGSTVSVHGRRDAPLPSPDFTGRRPVILFPRENATVLTREFATAGDPVTLVVPDGNWSQARRMHRRVSWMGDLACVTLPPSERVTRYHLRRSPRQGGLATMEAIARALGILEAPEVEATLERIFTLFVSRTMAARGTPVEGAEL
ncbi:MAG: DTW domain-containing protein [Clostridia bacterium]|nr:DTW domain-containing protein [Deltaproteobacteria bacterium]